MDNRETQLMTTEQTTQALEEFAAKSPPSVPSPGLSSEERHSQYVKASGKEVPGPVSPVLPGTSEEPAQVAEDTS